MSKQTHVYGLRFLGKGLVSLIANGQKESTEIIEQKCENGTIIDYLDLKYASNGLGYFGKGNRPEHHIPDMISFLQNAACDLSYRAQYKYAIEDEKMAGLPMLLNVILEELSE